MSLGDKKGPFRAESKLPRHQRGCWWWRLPSRQPWFTVFCSPHCHSGTPRASRLKEGWLGCVTGKRGAGACSSSSPLTRPWKLHAAREARFGKAVQGLGDATDGCCHRPSSTSEGRGRPATIPNSTLSSYSVTGLRPTGTVYHHIASLTGSKPRIQCIPS